MVLVTDSHILLYDNTASSNEYSEKENLIREENAKIIRPELIKLKDKVKESEKYIMEYIKEVVFPQIGIIK